MVRKIILKIVSSVKKLINLRKLKLVDVNRNELFAYRCYGNKVEKIYPIIFNPSAKILGTQLIQTRGIYNVDGFTFDLSKDGLYRFYKLPQISEQRIICKNNFKSASQILGYLFCYGNKDDKLSLANMLKEITNRTLSLGCKSQAELSKEILKGLSVNSRIVACSSLAEWNGQNDGHTMLEIVNKNRKIFVYDPSFRRVFPNSNIFELCLKGIGHSKQKMLPGNLGNSGFSIKNYDYSFWVEQRLLSSQLLEEWYDHVLQVPLIMENSFFCYPLLDKFTNRDVERLNSVYKQTPITEFNNRFY